MYKNSQYVWVTNLLPRRSVSDFVLQPQRNKGGDGKLEVVACIGGFCFLNQKFPADSILLVAGTA